MDQPVLLTSSSAIADKPARRAASRQPAKLELAMINMYTKFEVSNSSLSHSRDILVGPKL